MSITIMCLSGLVFSDGYRTPYQARNLNQDKLEALSRLSITQRERLAICQGQSCTNSGVKHPSFLMKYDSSSFTLFRKLRQSHRFY